MVRTSQRYLTDRVIKYALMEARFPEVAFDEISPQKALDRLILKYIRQFGPVCLKDLCWWLPVSKTLAHKTIDNRRNKLPFFSFNSDEYFMQHEDHLQLMEFNPADIKETIINFLPYEDHFPKAYSIRNWFLPEDSIPLVYLLGRINYGQIRPSIWFNGKVIGRWELNWVDKAKSSMKIEIVDINEKLNLSNKITELIDVEKKNLETFVNEKLRPLIIQKSSNH